MKLLKTIFLTIETQQHTRLLKLLIKQMSLVSLSLCVVMNMLVAQDTITPAEEFPIETTTLPNANETEVAPVEQTDVSSQEDSLIEEEPTTVESNVVFPEEITISPLSIYNEGVKSYNNEDYAVAIEKLEQLIALRSAPNTTQALNLLARAYTRQAYHLEENIHDISGAERHYRLALENFGKLTSPYEQMVKRLYSFAYNRLGVLIYNTQFDADDSTTDIALKEAFRNFNNAININKENSSAYNNKGIAYSAQGDSRPAIATFTKAIEYNENNAIAYLNRGTDHFFINDLNAALSDFKEVVRYQILSNMITDPDEARSSLIYAKEMLGFTHLALGNSLYHESLYGSAIDNYRQALMLMSELGEDATDLKKLNTNIHLYLGTTYAQEKDFPKAMAEIERALVLNPDYADAYNNLGIVYYELDNFQKAVETYTKAIEKSPELAEAYLNRGNAYNQLDMTEAAQSDYEMATRLGLNVFTYFKKVTKRSQTRSRFVRTHHAYANQSLRVKKAVPTKKVFIF